MNEELSDKVAALYREIASDVDVFGVLVVTFLHNGNFACDVAAMITEAANLMGFYRREFEALVHSKESLDRLAAYLRMN